MFPSAADELALHERVLATDPVAPADVFEAFMDPLLAVLKADLRCEGDLAYDSAVDAVFGYLQEPDKYDRSAGRLSTYLAKIAKNKTIDRLRSRGSSADRDTHFAEVVEVGLRDPKEVMEDGVEARQAWARVCSVVTDQKDRAALLLILEGEGETSKLAEVLGLDDLPLENQRHQVKRERDRLMKALGRLGKKLTDGQP